MAEPINSFVPSGVDAGTWMGFEQRIRRRRFAALLEQFGQAVSSSDREAAQSALDEARELRPDAPEVRAAAERLALLNAEPEPAPVGYVWSRVFGAVALLLIGVSMLIGLDWMRMSHPVPVAPPAASLPALGRLNVPQAELVVARPDLRAPGQSADAAEAATSSHPPSGWNKVLKLFGVEVIQGTPTTAVRVRRAI